MNQTKKRIGSLFLAVCVAVTMLPMAAFAETGNADSGNALGSDGTITAFAKLDEDIAAQLVETGTPEEELNLPEELEVTVSRTVTDDGSGDGVATDSEAQEPKVQKETVETVVDVSGWTADSIYDGDTEGVYVFTPVLALPDGLKAAKGAEVPWITVTVTEPAKAGMLSVPMRIAVPTGTITGTMTVGGEHNILLSTDGAGTGWSWNASDAVLTLDSSYPDSKEIIIQCGSSDDINLILTGDVAIHSSPFVLSCNGNLNIKAGDYTLNLFSTDFVALGIGGNLAIESGTVITTGGDKINAIQVFGDVTISGSANVTAVSPGGNGFYGASGIASISGNVHISTSGEVDTSGHKNGIYAGDGITISKGTVTAAGTDPAALVGISSGVTVTGGTLTTSGANGDVIGGLTVSGADTVVTVVGNIKHLLEGDNTTIIRPGDLTVSGGTVTVTGAVEGAQNLTGGVVTIGGNVAYPVPPPAVSLGVTVGGVEVTAANADNITGPDITGSIRYDAAAKTLTLTDAFIRRDQYLTGTGIWSEHDLTVRLVGNNVLGELNNGIYSLSAGIAATSTSSIILTGNGSLTIYDVMSGVVAGNVTVSSTGRLVIKENGTAKACCLKAESGTLTINSGTLELISQNSNALYGSSIIINGGTITAIANNAHQDVTGDFFAFTSRPVFGTDYGHRVYAGTSASDARLISAPTDSTFTASNYVRIEPVTGGNNGSSSNGGSGGGSGSGGSGNRFSKGASSANSSIPETSGTWNQDQKGWRFAKPDGSNYTNEWVYVKNCWYRIGADGYMQQGWNTVEGKAYYLVPVSGEMKTGWLFDNNRWYYLVPASGEMKTGWVQVDGKWYYLNEDGTMASDAVTPDGYRVGADGAWVN